jgi:hypothetical protein
VQIIGYRASDPNYKSCEFGALQPKCNYHHQNRRAYFINKSHGSKIISMNGDVAAKAHCPVLTIPFATPARQPKEAKKGFCEFGGVIS